MTHERLCAECLAGVDPALVERIAAARPRVPAELRGLVLALLAEPGDRTAMSALGDWIAENREPPVYVTIGKETVARDQPLHFRDWRRLFGGPDRPGTWAMAAAVCRAIREQVRGHARRTSEPNIDYWDGYPTHLHELLRLTPAQLYLSSPNGQNGCTAALRWLNNNDIYLRGQQEAAAAG